MNFVETLLQDVRYGLHMLAKNPDFTAVAVLTLALGIGANTAVFSVADAFLLKPLPFQALDRLVVVLEVAPKQKGDDTSGVSPGNFEDWKSQNRSFDQLAAYVEGSVNLTGLGDPERIQIAQVTQNFFETLQVHPIAGRTFTPDEDGHDREVILSQGLWERRFGSDPALLGKAVTLDEMSYTVVGIMPKSLDFPTTADLWSTLALGHSGFRVSHPLVAVGRLKDGVSITQARAEMSALAARLGESYPLTKGWGVRVMSLRLFVTGDLTRQYTLLLLGAVAFVLLIACANVANLHLVRASSRQKELAVRAALGASRWRVIRQLLTESVLLSLVGAAFGLLFAEWAVRLILAHMPPEVAKFIVNWNKISLDHRSFLFTLGIAVLAGVVSGVVPSFQSSRPDLIETLKEGSRTTSAGRERRRLRNMLVVAEIALALILLVGSGLMVKSFRALLDSNQSFDPKTVLTMRVNLVSAKYRMAPETMAALVSFYTQVLERLRGTPGVLDAAVSTNIPSAGYDWPPGGFSVEGGPAHDASELRAARNSVISPDYFRTMHIPVLQGRGFTDQDLDGTRSVVIVSELLARRCWSNQNPLGRRIKMGVEGHGGPWMTIVGVVGDVKYNWSERDPRPTIYHPYTQLPPSVSYIVVRASGDPQEFIARVRDQIAAVDRDQPISNIQTLDRVLSNSVLWIGYVAVMMSVLGIIALILSSVGVFGVMSYLVTERTHEIGVRMALGATRSDILRMVVRRGIFLIAIGLSIGLPISVLLARLLSRLVFWVSATDLITFGGVSLALAVIALLAGYLPALRATHVDPMVALRYE